MSECQEWRPLAMKGICECQLRFHEHSQAVQEDALRLVALAQALGWTQALVAEAERRAVIARRDDAMDHE